MVNFSEALESYMISDDADLIAIESFIYSALESDTSSAPNNDLKKNLSKLANAKAKNDDEKVKEVKEEINENIRDLESAAAREKNEKRKAKLKKAAKIGGIIAGTIAVAATLALAIKKLRNDKALRDAKAMQEVRDNFMREHKPEMERKINEVRNEMNEVTNKTREMSDRLKKIKESRDANLAEFNKELSGLL